MAYNDSTIKLAIDAYLQYSFVNGSFIKKVFHYKIMKYISICINLQKPVLITTSGRSDYTKHT
jgi:hypothetical protein